MLIRDQLKQIELLSNNEQLAADYFLREKNNFQDESLRSIASKLYISPSTIVRLCHKLGFESYNDFKKAYQDELNYLQNSFEQLDPNEPFTGEDNNDTVAHKIGYIYSELVKDTMNLLASSSLDQAVALCSKADTIYICASSSKVSISSVFAEKMAKIGKNVIVCPFNNVQYYYACSCKETDCFIIITYSGETPPIIKTANMLKKRKIRTILITSYGGSTVADLFPIKLYMSTHENIVDAIGDYGAHLTPLLWLDIIYSCVFHNDHENNKRTRHKYARSYEDIRHSNNPYIQEGPKQYDNLQE